MYQLPTMDINEILSQAKRNQKETTTVNRYNTDVKPAKKLSRSVNPSAVKAFLDKKQKEETKMALQAKKKKEKLEKLRDVSKTTTKANSMAKRTKDNLKVYKGEDLLGLYPEPKKKRRRGSPPPTPLSPEQEKKYKTFMKHIVPKVRVPGVNDDESDGGYKEPVLERDGRKIRKLEKKKAKARSASNLEFNDLLQLAEKHKNKMDDSSSESDEGSESDGSRDRYGRPLTAEEKYQRERRKRRELEERLKTASLTKHIGTSDKRKRKLSPNFANFKIGKLNTGLSEESKAAKVKALMEKFKKSSHEKIKEKKPEKRDQSSSKRYSKSSLPPKEKSTKKIVNVEHKHNGVKSHPSDFRHGKPSLSNGKPSSSNGKPSSSNDKVQLKYNSTKSFHKKVKTSMPSSDSKMRQTKIENHLKPKRKEPEPSVRGLESSEKRMISNPYKHTVVKQNGRKKSAADSLVDPWAKTQKEPLKKPKPIPAGKCTLSVTSETVRTNYPDVAREDPYIEAYKKTGKVIPKFTPEMIARYKAAMIRKLQHDGKLPPSHGNHHPPPLKKRYGVIGDESDDEYDSDMDEFIADEDPEEDIEEDIDISSHIKQIFGYDKSKYGRESEWELSKMDASYKDIEREEKRSLRIAKEEDAREAKLEEERMNRMLKKKK